MGLSNIAAMILVVRGQRVLMDRDLADLYGVSTGALNRAVRRNFARFPADFMFQLSAGETRDWISQVVISNSRLRMGARRKPYVFTEQGVAMLSGVLHSGQAIRANIAIMRTFVGLRKTLAAGRRLAGRVQYVEKKIGEHDGKFLKVFEQLSRLEEPAEEQTEPRKNIGFKASAG